MKKLLLMMSVCLAFACCADKNGKQADNNSAIDAIMSRVSVRQFTGDKLSEQQIETILRAGMAAPTAVNKQPWAFVVVDDEAELSALAQAIRSSRIENGASHAIVVCGDMQKALEGEAQGYWVEDTSAATENMLLAAHAMGLGALWVGVYPISERVAAVKEIIGAPEHIVPMCLVVVGVANEQPEIKNKFKEENIIRNRF